MFLGAHIAPTHRVGPNKTTIFDEKKIKLNKNFFKEN